MQGTTDKHQFPAIIEDYLAQVGRQIRSKRIRKDVLCEVRDHFVDALEGIEDEDRQAAAEVLIEDFGDTKLLGRLIKRAKKRCRPAWVLFLVRSVQAVAILIILLIAYVVSFIAAKPSPGVDYIGELNQMVRPAVSETLNAATHYIKAYELYVGPANDIMRLTPTPGCRLEPGEREKLLDWIGQNEPALSELRKGANKPYCWFRYEGKEVIAVPLPWLSSARSLARALCWQFWLDETQTEQQIIDDVKVMHTQAKHLKTNTITLIEQLVGMAMHGRVSNQTLLLLQEGKITQTSLPLLAKMLSEVYPEGYTDLDFRGERIMWLDLIQRNFTNTGIGGGHILLGDLGRVRAMYGGPRIALGMIFVQPRRKATLKTFEDYYRMGENVKTLTPYEREQLADPNPEKTFVDAHQRNMFALMLLPTFSRASESNWRGRAELEAVQTVVALRQYKADHGRFPVTLKELSPKYLTTLPRDPYSAGSLRYKVIGESFLLYSVGVDFKDDDGKHRKSWGTPREKGGDYVFWPPQPIEREKK